MINTGTTAQPVNVICGNCGAAVSCAYCSACGQDTKSGPPTVAEYVHELIAHFIHLDGKVLRTLGTLFFLPGKLAHDYLANKRVRYVKPLRLYFVLIAIAFTVVQFQGRDLGLKLGDVRFNLLKSPRTNVVQDRSSADTSHWVLKYFDTPGIRRFNELSPEEQLKVTRERGIRYVPYLVLGLVPIFAAWLQRAYGQPDADTLKTLREKLDRAAHLDLFVEAGWAEARQLTHRLEEIYR